MNAATPGLRLRGIEKRFAATVANAGIDLDIMPGEIHALLGENGAGKSTLVKIVYGVLAPDAGSIEWEGRKVRIVDPNFARRLGIGMVFQHFSLFETLTVAENIALGLGGAESPRRLAPRIRETAAQYGLAVDPDRHVHNLSVGERQRIEILRCLLQAPRLLIMDEPTSVLTPQEAEALFVLLRRLAAEGCAILYISHKLDEIQALCHAATVLRGGRVSGTCDPARETPRSMAEMMVGAEIDVPRRAATLAEHAAVALRVEGLTLDSVDPFGTTLRDISMELRAGEVLGIAGVAGNGQSELLAALAGEVRAPRAGMISICGTPAGRLDVGARRRLGLAFIPEERIGRGAVAGMTLTENALLTGDGGPCLRRGFIRRGALRDMAAGIIARFGVLAAGTEADAASLSGGNMQKFIVGREVAAHPRVLLASHPTWGVDVGAALTIRQALIDLAGAGAAVLVVSEDLSELFEIADRIAVLHGGHLSAPLPIAQATVEQIGLLMGGARPELEVAA